MSDRTTRPTVLVTGTSSGIGHATALCFHRKGWNVVATMRNPKPELLPDDERVAVLALDVTDSESISRALEQAVARFGSIDVIVNNAGHGLLGFFHSFTEPEIEENVSTNFLGAVRVMRAATPHFRERGAGVFVNISSMASAFGFPLNSYYCAAKAALEIFSEAARKELSLIGVKVKVVQLGQIDTPFGSHVSLSTPTRVNEAEQRLFAALTGFFRSTAGQGLSPDKAAEVIFKAATDGKPKMRYVVGNEVRVVRLLRRLFPEPLVPSLLLKKFLSTQNGAIASERGATETV